MASIKDILSDLSDSSVDTTPIRPYRAGAKGRLVARKPKSTKDRSTAIEGPKAGDSSSAFSESTNPDDDLATTASRRSSSSR